ncbi:uncharacterized protein EV422DRAFT_544353 [Fimicolochytrium jonesii]|uniref:uncharacterized protein n=1 Tax=Fimicolochytrium jonesii TaxID=1396493 RepID=UPI0022FE6ACE|nr:uncharacterized protein EV422DRAFT_544353 [Fimicolochytrium jonesii]KAI8816872.1 hypothetical protein EV422DRAFT_544353 [Fimicolochytrium jonesii]
MSRVLPYRSKCPDAVKALIPLAQTSTLFVVQEMGPLAFIVRQENDDRNYRVKIGSVQMCTCEEYVSEGELCLHVIWIMHKKFRVAETDEKLWQRALVDREIAELLKPKITRAARRAGRHKPTSGEHPDLSTPAAQRGPIAQRSISDDDVCPICQETLQNSSKHLTFCSKSCGNSVHLKCMKMVMEHQTASGTADVVKCPLCRNVFATVEELTAELAGLPDRQAIHWVTCKECDTKPISGNCYRCKTCGGNYTLCQPCFRHPTNKHTNHTFETRRWPRDLWAGVVLTQPSSEPAAVIPEGMMRDMQGRDLTDEDYEVLLRLDDGDGRRARDGVREEVLVPLQVVARFPTNVVKTRTEASCKICSEQYHVNDVLRKLPSCGHAFHRNCIDRWLLQRRPVCPIDGVLAWNPNDEPPPLAAFDITSSGTKKRARKKKRDRGRGIVGDAGRNEGGLIVLAVTGAASAAEPTLDPPRHLRRNQVSKARSNHRSSSADTSPLLYVGHLPDAIEPASQTFLTSHPDASNRHTRRSGLLRVPLRAHKAHPHPSPAEPSLFVGQGIEAPSISIPLSVSLGFTPRAHQPTKPRKPPLAHSLSMPALPVSPGLFIGREDDGASRRVVPHSPPTALQTRTQSSESRGDVRLPRLVRNVRQGGGKRGEHLGWGGLQIGTVMGAVGAQVVTALP